MPACVAFKILEEKQRRFEMEEHSDYERESRGDDRRSPTGLH